MTAGLALLLTKLGFSLPITLATRSKARSVYTSNTEIVGSNLTRSLDICLRFFRVSIVLCMQLLCEGAYTRPRVRTH
jgi:hypothetical protein